jgi:hypothetical protein
VIRSTVLTGRTVRRFSAAWVLPVCLVAGCGGQPAIPQPNQTQTTTPTVAPPVRPAPTRPPSVNQAASQGGSDMVTLDQRFMPFAAGRSWTYQVSATSAGKTDEGQVTWTVDNANPDDTAITVRSTVGGTTHTVSNRVVKNADATITITTTTDGQVQSQTVKPEDMPAGQSPQAPGAAAAAMQGSSETVTVPAGTFEAVKVVTQLPEGKGSITAWYVPDIGMVKQDIQATTDTGPVTSMMALTAHS